MASLQALRAEEAARAERVSAAESRLAAAVKARIAAEAADEPGARRRVARAVKHELELAGDLRVVMEDLSSLSQLVAALTPDQVLAGLERDVPLALLPVRLEARYRIARLTAAGPGVGPPSELHVRVYPEPIHVDSHEPELTAEELEAGEAFWTAAAEGEEAAREAWSILTRSGGERRAAWIRRATAPGAPPVALKRASWTRAARAAALPGRFVFLALRGGKRIATAVGEPVKRSLAIGLDPTVKQGAGPAGLDEGTRWMVEFDAAESVGMAARLQLPATEHRIDRLLAVGVAGSLTPQQAADELDRLLEVHRFTDGLSLLAAGTPTNVSSMPSAGPEQDTYALEAGQPPSIAPAGATAEEAARAAATDAARVAAALGSGAEHLGRSVGAGGISEPDARAMLAVLWPGTLGYYLSEMLGESVNEDEAERLRSHAVNWVRPRGPLATLRIGSQPYGVLPVTALSRYVPPPGAPDGADRFVSLLRRLNGVWATAARSVPRAGAGDDLEAAMAEILGQSPLAVDYRIRKVHYQGSLIELAALAGLSDEERDGLAGVHEGLAGAGAGVVGKLRAGDGLRLTVNADRTRQLALPRVQAAPLSELNPLADNYLAFLRMAPVAEVVAGERRFGSPLLYLLARLGLLFQYLSAVGPAPGDQPSREEWLDRHLIVEGLPGVEHEFPGHLLGGSGTVAPDVLNLIHTAAIERATIDSPILTGSSFGNPWEEDGPIPAPRPRVGLRRRDAGAAASAATSGELVSAASALTAAPAGTDAVAEVLSGLEHLESRPTSVLDRLLRETLDLAGHRLDPWVTSLATERLRAMRDTPAAGVHLGAYGWIEDLAPGPRLTPVPDDEHQDVGRPLMRRPGEAGFVHAPSPAHAATAGVLRSAHLAHGGRSEMAIDLSSRRVRSALWLLDGVRAGQPLTALLGYRLERALHDRALDRLIAGLRDAAPLSRTRLATDGEPSEAVAAHDVVDGLRLLELLDAGDLRVADLAPAADRNALSQELTALADAADAVADLLLAESVHQLVGGNPVRASAAAGAASGGHVPADLEVVRTPRGGTAVTHRVAVVHGGPGVEAWPAAKDQVRAVLDPVVEDLAARLLGPPSRVRVGVRWRDRATGKVLGPNPANPAVRTTVTLDALGLSALDFVMTAAPVVPDARGEVERRLADLAMRGAPAGLRPERVAPDAEVELVLDTPQVAGGVDLPTLLVVAASVRRALGRSRALEPADVAPTGTGDDAGLAVGDLEGRITAALGIARTARNGLADALAGDDKSLDLEAVRAALRAVAATGLPASWPLNSTGHDDAARAELIAQARSVLADLETRLGRAADGLAGLTAPAAGVLGTAADAQRRRRAAQEVFGEELPLLAPLAGDARDAALKAFASGPEMGPAGTTRAGRSSLVRSYISSAAAVRRDLSALDEALDLCAAIDAPEPAIVVAQFGAAARPWAGLADKPGAPLGGCTSVVALAPAGEPAGADTVSGLLVDEWLEVVPAETEVTALAIHANRPNAEAPQAVLLAVPPDPAKAWDLDTLSAVLEETLDSVSRRVVDLPALPALGQHLPALFVNSTDSSPLLGLPFNQFVVPGLLP